MIFKKENSPHVTILVDLEIGQKFMIDEWGPALNGKICTIEDIRLCSGSYFKKI